MWTSAHDAGVFDPAVCLFHVVPDPRRNQRRNFILLLSLALVTQFLLSLEIFATMTLLGAFAVTSAWSFSVEKACEKIPALLASIACAYGIALIVVSPYLYYFFAYEVHISPRYPPPAFSVYPLNSLIPTAVDEIGRIALFRSISAGFVSGWTAEAGAYLSLPLMLVVALYVRRYWCKPIGRLLTYCLAAAIVLSLGRFCVYICQAIRSGSCCPGGHWQSSLC